MRARRAAAEQRSISALLQLRQLASAQIAEAQSGLPGPPGARSFAVPFDFIGNGAGVTRRVLAALPVAQ
jgi:hypothetical protein